MIWLPPSSLSLRTDALEDLSLQETFKKPGYSSLRAGDTKGRNYTEIEKAEELQLFQLFESSQPRHHTWVKKHLR